MATELFLLQRLLTTGAGPAGIIAANFAGAPADLAVADESAHNVDLLIGNGDGTFNAPISLPIGEFSRCGSGGGPDRQTVRSISSP